MSGIGLWVPVERSTEDGYIMIKDYGTLVKQNLKNLVLTAPGERMMDPVFGVGLRNFLFEQNITSVRASIQEKIQNQINIYMPFLKVNKINILALDESNTVKVSIAYTIPGLNRADRISLEVSLKNSSI